MSSVVGQQKSGVVHLSQLMREHASQSGRHPLELREVLGDGVLLNRIKPFSRLRQALVAMGYQLKPAKELFGLHAMFPTLELASILEARAIPYRNSTNALQSFLVRMPNFQLDTLLFRDVCTANHIFHEGAHALFFEQSMGAGEAPSRERIVDAFIGSEAFALAFERFCTFLSLDDPRPSTAVFLALNSYATPLTYADAHEATEEWRAGLSALAVSAPKQLLCFLTSAYLIALLRPGVQMGSAALANWLAAYCQLPQAYLHYAEPLLATGFSVTPDFRHKTIGDFFRLLGFSSELASVRARPLEDHLDHSSLFSISLDAAMAAVLDGTNVSCARERKYDFFSDSLVLLANTNAGRKAL